MADCTPHLLVVNYHYIDDHRRGRLTPATALPVEEFRRQLEEIARHFDIVTCDQALAFLEGRRWPPRPLCLLTFDDALREHYETVVPILRQRSIQGVFLVQTASLDGEVADVHKTHLLQATLDPDRLIEVVTAAAGDLGIPETAGGATADALEAYPFDTPAVAAMKYLINFRLPPSCRSTLLANLVARHVAPEHATSRALYLTWDDARDMQRAGMVLGGHSHRHLALAAHPITGQRDDIDACASRLHAELAPQAVWPFSYPNGSCTPQTKVLVRAAGFSCAFTTEYGVSDRSTNRFAIRRVDATEIHGGRLRPRGRHSDSGTGRQDAVIETAAM
jgi:peptidoglycan/xylan/chitin deacetylase (PgdA/CDA1 family)